MSMAALGEGPRGSHFWSEDVSIASVKGQWYHRADAAVRRFG